VAAPDGFGIDGLFAEWTDTAMVRLQWMNSGLAVLASDSVCFYLFLTERALTRF
jgi:hypothetical protein